MNEDTMDKNIEAYIESFVLAALEYCKAEDEEQIREYLYNSVIEAVIDNLNEEQLNEIKDSMQDMPVLLSKIEQFSSEVPDMADIIEDYLTDALEKIKENPGVINSTE